MDSLISVLFQVIVMWLIHGSSNFILYSKRTLGSPFSIQRVIKTVFGTMACTLLSNAAWGLYFVKNQSAEYTSLPEVPTPVHVDSHSSNYFLKQKTYLKRHDKDGCFSGGCSSYDLLTLGKFNSYFG